jgi:hypothetical protein
MNYLPFVCKELPSLPAELKRPIRRVSIYVFRSAWGPNTLTLWHSDGTGLKIFSQMHDIAERMEIGVLNFEKVTALADDEITEDVSAAFDCNVEVFKLIVDDEGTRAECGLALQASNGDQITIVPSAGPCYLAILGVFAATPHIFEPEYPLDRYVRVPIT